MMTTAAAVDFFNAKLATLRVEFPGLSFGYIGNYGRHGDDRSWRFFLPHPGRIGTYADCVSLGSTAQLPGSTEPEAWAVIEGRIRRGMIGR
jgi:hypothetical protein